MTYPGIPERCQVNGCRNNGTPRESDGTVLCFRHRTDTVAVERDGVAELWSHRGLVAVMPADHLAELRAEAKRRG